MTAYAGSVDQMIKRDELARGTPGSNWTETKGSGKTLLTYEAFYNKAETELTKLYNNIMNGGTDSNGLNFEGLTASSPSHAYVAENIMKFLIVCAWVDKNMLYYNDGSQIKNVNVFYYQDEPNLPRKELQALASEYLNTIQSKVKEKYPNDTNTYGELNPAALLSIVKDVGTVWNHPRDAKAPGGDNYANAYNNGLNGYILQNIANILAKEMGDDVCEYYTKENTRYGQVFTDLAEYLKSGTKPNTGSSSGSGTTDPDPNQPPAPVVTDPPDPSTSESPEPSESPAPEVEWPEKFDFTNSLLIGDTVLAMIANNQGWADPKITLKDPASMTSGGNVTTDQGDPTGYFFIDKSGKSPVVVGSSRATYDAYTPAGSEYLNAIELIPATSFAGITDVYVLVGYDFASNYDPIHSTLYVTSDSSVTPEQRLESAFGTLDSCLKEKILLGGNSYGTATRVTFFTQPLPDASNAARQYVELFNNNLEKWVEAQNTFMEISRPGVRYRVLQIDGSYSNIAGYWSNAQNAVNKVAEEEKKEEASKPPTGTTTSGNDANTIYNLYNKYRSELKDIIDIYEHTNTYAGSLWSYGFEGEEFNGTTYTGYFSPWSGYDLTANDLVKDLYEQGYLKDPNLGKPSDTSPGVDNEAIARAQSTLELISNATHNGYEVVVPDKELDDAELNSIGYVALAAGVVYDPFNSIAGDETYLETVRYMLEEASDIEKIERLLQDAFSRKKPLYVLDGSKSKWSKEEELETSPTGDYRFAYLADVLQHDENTTRVYAVVKGGMQPSTVDSSTWEYATGGVQQSQSNTSASVESSAPTDNGSQIKTNSSQTATVAGAQMMATQQQMSAPVMFTSGAKNGVFVGNFDNSASGYAASLGGLTTVILHNAAQDAKSNSYIQTADSQMLFMDGLGNIVLADGTMVLPAIANPAIYTYSTIQYDVDSAASWETIATTALGVAGAVGITIATAGAGAPVLAIWGVGVASTAGGVVLGQGAGSLLDSLGESDSATEVQEVYKDTCAYYPYTAAFMNHYPSVIINSEGRLAVTNTNDEGKYVMGFDDVGNLLARRINGLNNKTQVNLQYSGGGITVAPVQGLSFNVTSNTKAIGTALPYLSGKDGTWTTTMLNTARKFKFFMVKDSIYSSNDQAYFPLTDDMAELSDSYLELSGPLVTSAYRFLTEREHAAESDVHHETFNVKRYIVDMAGEGLLGTQYGETLQKNYKISYDELVEDTGNRLLTFFVQIVESAIENLGRIDGVLAIKNGYENAFFNKIVSFVQEFYLLIAVVLLIIVAVKFIRGHYNIIFVMFIAALCVCGFEVYANWMPTVVPAAYNFAVNDAVEQIAWNTTVVSAESYAETYKDSSRKDPTTGALKPYTATLTLYKMTRADMESVASRLGTTYKAIKSGEVFYLDETAGIFVQGDAIKISVDKLLVNNSMRGLFFTQWQEVSEGFTESEEFITPITDESAQIGNPYTVQLTQPYVSLEAYYMPYNEIERAFLINLNAFASLFRFERNQFSYGRNLYKDAFLFNCFTNSGIFTAPGVEEVLCENIKVGSVVGPYGSDDNNVRLMLQRVYGDETHEGVFTNPKDWLNASMVFLNPSTNMKTSLWGTTMQERGWYDADWNLTTEGVDAIGDLIAYMNEQTKQFVIANSDQLNFCSDENAIKIVSLYATTTFTHYVSQFGDWLYPNYLNAADIELKDVLYGSMTTLRDRNFAYDGTVVNTVAYNLGVFGVIFLLLITVLATLFVFVMTYLVPVLYAMFGAILIFKLINNKEGVGLVKGYVKVTGVTMVLYFIFSLSLRLVEVGGYAWYGYLGCALVMFLCCYFLFWVVLSVVTNAGEMGNEVLGQNLLRGMDAITRGAVRKLTTNTLNARRGIRGYGGMGYGYGYGSPYQYGRGYGVDGRDYIRGSRRGFVFGHRGYGSTGLGGYGRGALYDDGLYEREGRRGLSRVIDGLPFSGRGRGSHNVPSRSASRTRGHESQSGMSRYASRR